MFSCEFSETSHNTIFKEPKKQSISGKNAIVDEYFMCWILHDDVLTRTV